MAFPGTPVGASLTRTVNNWQQAHIVIFHSLFPRRLSRSRSRGRGRDAGGGGGFAVVSGGGGGGDGGVGDGGGGGGGGVGVVSGVFTSAGGPFTLRTMCSPYRTAWHLPRRSLEQNAVRYGSGRVAKGGPTST